ncbi:nuclease [Moorena producens PAL-8-15-08-1]|uniref:Nuclease n=1 Tax=Moorena producens PAL-8-15-08-1 TaxID=1458985 RepID=A0A1D8U1M5_9CYAN|nr:nuclease [Moorena producens PAL-8-15-08-1]
MRIRTLAEQRYSRAGSLLSCFLLFLGGCQLTNVPNQTSAQVQQVISGHTVDVLITNQDPPLVARIRMIGIEAPSWKQKPWGDQAKTCLQKILSETSDQQSVMLELDVEEQDRYSRWLAYVWIDGVLVNEQLVAKGCALASPLAPNNKYDEKMARAQEYARIMGYGIWNPDQPLRLTPAEFRRQNP